MTTLRGKRIGFGLTGSHCTYEAVFPQIEALVKEGAEVRPVGVVYGAKHEYKIWRRSRLD